MSNILLDFQQAKVKHLQFKSNLRSILYGAADIDENPVLSHFDCTVGKWIYEYALGQYGYLPEMIALENVHADIHTKAQQLVQLYKAGSVLEARSGLAEMESIAEKLVNLLSLLEGKIISSASNFKYTRDYQTPEITILELQKLTQTNEELDKIISRQSLELLHERKIVKDLLMQFPALIVILKGSDHIIEMANNPFFMFAAKDKIIGLSIKEVLPELKDQGIFEVLDNVYASGELTTLDEKLIKINNKNNAALDVFLNMSIIALRKADDTIDGILLFSYEVTQQVQARIELENRINQLTLEHQDNEMMYKTKIKQLEDQINHLNMNVA